MARKSGKASNRSVESLSDLNASNVWSVEGYRIALMWKKECSMDSFASREDKLLNIIRSAFDVAIYKEDDVHSMGVYESGEWITFGRDENMTDMVAIRPKQIKRLSDLNSENVKHISVATVLELIDRNFGGGWDSVSPDIQKVIESCFQIISIQLPSLRLHAPGGVLERKLKDGFEVLEIAKGTWTEAIFVKQKVVEDFCDDNEDDYDDENKYRDGEDDVVFDETDDVVVEDGDDTSEDIMEGEFVDDDTLFSSFMDEDGIVESDEGVSDGFTMEEE